jgi:hypothetical protein
MMMMMADVILSPELKVTIVESFSSPQRKLLCCRIWDLRRWWGVVRHPSSFPSKMGGDDQPLVITDEPVEVQEFWKFTHHCSGICGIYLVLITQKTERCQHCHGFDLETLGSRPVRPQILPFRNSSLPTTIPLPSL